MTAPENLSPTSDEKLMGALAHVFGPLAAMIVWALQKDKSRFAKFQALQALVFDLVAALVMGAFFFCIFAIGFLGMFGSIFMSMNDPASVNDPVEFFLLPFMFPFTIFGCVFPFSFILLAVRLIAAVSVLNGRNYRYPIIGKWLDDFMQS